jgi:hypothetical protein
LKQIQAPPEDNPILELGDQLPPRWVAPLFLGMVIVLIPWIVYLAFTLPHRAIAHHYNLSWVGFDVLLLLAIASTGYLAFRRRREVELPAIATATLLVVDAWFDITTSSRGWPLIQAILLAVFIELPAAALAFYISRRVERFTRPPRS